MLRHSSGEDAAGATHLTIKEPDMHPRHGGVAQDAGKLLLDMRHGGQDEIGGDRDRGEVGTTQLDSYRLGDGRVNLGVLHACQNRGALGHCVEGREERRTLAAGITVLHGPLLLTCGLAVVTLRTCEHCEPSMADAHPDVRQHPWECGRPGPEESLPHSKSCHRPHSATLRGRFRATEDLVVTASHVKVFALTVNLQAVTLDLHTIARQRHNQVQGRDCVCADDTQHIVRADANEAAEGLQIAPVGRIDGCRRRLHVDLDPFAEVLLGGHKLSKILTQRADITLIDKAAGNSLNVCGWLVRRGHRHAKLRVRGGGLARTCDKGRHGVVGGER
mmetsp:Transcript_30461/g.76578  ORF Transcript_30461/g.76578 Transcript_30461/m.76578 type:complete len:332 (-) Transcript_30461:59-1054(-)